MQGVDVKNDKIQIYADLIEKELGISCSSLSGANIANEGELLFQVPGPILIFFTYDRRLRTFGLIHGKVAQEKFSETTIGYRNEEEGKVWKSILGEPRTL